MCDECLLGFDEPACQKVAFTDHMGNVIGHVGISHEPIMWTVKFKKRNRETFQNQNRRTKTMRQVMFGFMPSQSSDVVSYTVIVKSEDGTAVMNKDIPVADFQTREEDGALMLDLSEQAELEGADGVYSVSVLSVDDAGNKSDEATLEGVDLDFLAPDAPSALFVVRL